MCTDTFLLSQESYIQLKNAVKYSENGSWTFSLFFFFFYRFFYLFIFIEQNVHLNHYVMTLK